MARRRSAFATCGFCSHEFHPDDRRFLIYPVPADEGEEPDLIDSRYACADCLPEVRKEQVRQGLMAEKVITVEEKTDHAKDS